MTDGSAAAALAGGEGGAAVAEGGAAAAAAGEGGQQQQSHPEWMNDVNPEFQSDPDLNRYKSPEEALKALKEARAWGRTRLPMPGADDEAGWTELGQRLRPESADGYNFEVPEEQDPSLANAFKQFAWDSGMAPRHAEAAVKFINQQTTETLSKLAADNQQELSALELDLGPAGYAQRIEAVNKMFVAAGLEGLDVASGLEHMLAKGADGTAKPSAAATMKALFALAEKTGELGKVDSVDLGLRMGTLTPAAAKAEVDRRSNDMSEEGRRWFGQAKISGTAENKRWNDLNMAIAKGG